MRAFLSYPVSFGFGFQYKIRRNVCTNMAFCYCTSRLQWQLSCARFYNKIHHQLMKLWLSPKRNYIFYCETTVAWRRLKFRRRLMRYNYYLPRVESCREKRYSRKTERKYLLKLTWNIWFIDSCARDID